MENRVFSFMDEQHMVEPGDRVVAGVSGGADSVCLLLLLLEYQKKLPFYLAVAHINHRLRKEAGEDACYVERLCKERGVPFFLYEKNVGRLAGDEKISLEEAGRKVRYEAYRETLRKWYPSQLWGKGKIAVAHHMQDSAETMLFNLFRGSGIRGLAGIRPVREEIIRPLLTVSRQEIENYLREKKVEWCIDSTNEEDTYTRNKIRNRLLPYAESQLVTGATRHVAQAAMEMRELVDFVEEELEKAVNSCVKVSGETEGRKASIILDAWRTLPAFLQKQVILWALEQVGEGRKNIGRIHLEALVMLTTKEGSKRIDLPEGLLAIKEYGVLTIQQRKEKAVVLYDRLKEELKIPGRFQLADGWYLELALIENGRTEEEKLGIIQENQYTKYLDYGKISNCLSLRYRERGDYLTINGAGQKKSLKEYMIQEKIPASMRDRIPLIAEGKHVLWVIGHRISSYYKVTDNTKLCLRMTIWRDEAWQKKYM